MSERKRWLMVIFFAAAMAWVEAAVVVYLRTLIGRLEPYQPDPLPNFGGLRPIEVIREVATMVMLLTVGWLAGRTWRSRLGYAVLAFGAWDILYYVFLAVIGPWPHSLWDWDILFLIPRPWWGPILAPMLIAALMILGGSLVALYDKPEQPLWPARWTWLPSGLGAGLALYTFMADAIRAVSGGETAIRNVLPVAFNWPLFTIGLILFATPIAEVSWQLWRRAENLSGLKSPQGIGQ
jgi:hypothetical protein